MFLHQTRKRSLARLGALWGRAQTVSVSVSDASGQRRLMVTLSGRYGALSTCSGINAMAGNAAFNAVLLLLFVGVLRAPRKSKVS